MQNSNNTHINRRELITLLSGSLFGSFYISCKSKKFLSSSNDHLVDPIYYSSAKSLAKAIKGKEISSEEVVRIFLKRIEKVNPIINAIVQINPENALKSARNADIDIIRGKPIGPLHGVPITIKDSIDTSEFISTGGTLGRANYIPMNDATVVKRLRAAGAII